MESVLTFMLIRFGLVVLGIAVLALVAVGVVAVVRRRLRTPEARERASSAVRSASEMVERRAGGTGTRGRLVGAAVRRAGGAAADRLGDPGRS